MNIKLKNARAVGHAAEKSDLFHRQAREKREKGEAIVRGNSGIFESKDKRTCEHRTLIQTEGIGNDGHDSSSRGV